MAMPDEYSYKTIERTGADRDRGQVAVQLERLAKSIDVLRQNAQRLGPVLSMVTVPGPVPVDDDTVKQESRLSQSPLASTISDACAEIDGVANLLCNLDRSLDL